MFDRLRPLLGEVAIATMASLVVLAGSFVGAFILGLFQTPLEALLAAALAISLCINAYAVIRTWRDRQRRGRPPSPEEREQIEANLARSRRLEKERETAWFATPGDLSTLKTTAEHLDQYLAIATTWAKREIGPDARLWFRTWRLHLEWGSSWIAFAGSSASAARRFSMYMTGPSEDHIEEFYRTRAEVQNGPTPTPPWRIDGTWKDLVATSWLRERPFEGSVTLDWQQDQKEEWRWVITYLRSGSEDLTHAPKGYTFVGGDLVVVQFVDTSVARRRSRKRS